MARTSKSERVPKKMQAKYDEIVALIDAVCQEHLNDEYAHLARLATVSLCRKRSSPLVQGQAKSWACGIVYALGTINFMFDKSQEPHMSAADLCAAFGVSKSSVIRSVNIYRQHGVAGFFRPRPTRGAPIITPRFTHRAGRM